MSPVRGPEEGEVGREVLDWELASAPACAAAFVDAMRLATLAAFVLALLLAAKVKCKGQSNTVVIGGA